MFQIEKVFDILLRPDTSRISQVFSTHDHRPPNQSICVFSNAVLAKTKAITA